MVRIPSTLLLPSTYDDFLHAPVGENANGALLTVLSVLARQNVDPWEQAADLSRLPPDTAAQRLTSMITASHVQPSTGDQAGLADRLIALLPRRINPADGTPDALQSNPMHRPASSVNLLAVAIFIGAMVLGQWIAASVF